MQIDAIIFFFSLSLCTKHNVLHFYRSTSSVSLVEILIDDRYYLLTKGIAVPFLLNVKAGLKCDTSSCLQFTTCLMQEAVEMQRR